MASPTNDISLNEGLYRFGGMFGYAVIDGHIRAEITELSATVEIARIDVPLVGSTRLGHKAGRETREGTFRVQKIDSHWENEVYKYLSQNLATRRANRGTAAGAMRPFNIQVWLDDPDTLDKEVWTLKGCMIWRMPLGFSIGDDLLDREFPFTWEEEVPDSTFEITHPTAANPVNGFPQITSLHSTNLTPPTA